MSDEKPDPPVVDKIRTRWLEVVDKDDEPRAVLFADDETGHVGLILLDETGKQRAELIHATGQQSILQFKAADGTHRITVISQDNGQSTVAISDEFGQDRLSLLIDRTVPSLLLMNSQGIRFAVQVPETGQPVISAVDEQGEPLQLFPPTA